MRGKFSKNLFRLTLAAVALAAVSTFAGLALGQVDDPTNPDLFRSFPGASDQETRPIKPTIQVIQPATPNANFAPRSRLEEIYNKRWGLPGHKLMQFGYDMLGVPSAVSLAQTGAMQDRYVLGSGDELVVQLRGQENASYHVQVDRDGKVILPKLPPVLASGRTLGDVRKDLEALVSRAFVSTSIFVSVGELRQVSVIVTGDVRAPGVRIISALANPLDALLLSGGVSKTGSLRAVQLIRDGTVRQIDLYSLLERGVAGSLGTLQDGDKLFVPPIGATVAIAGVVKHEGIFELRRGESAISATTLEQLAGGVEIAGSYTLSKITLENDGRTKLVPVGRNGVIRSGEILFVTPTREVSEDRVTLMGAVRLPGLRSRSTSPTIGQLIHGVDDLDPDAYTLFALIIRRDRASNSKVLLPVSLYRIFRGDGDVNLENDDVVYVLRADQIRDLARAADHAAPQNVTPGGPQKQSPSAAAGVDNNTPNSAANPDSGTDSDNNAGTDAPTSSDTGYQPPTTNAPPELRQNSPGGLPSNAPGALPSQYRQPTNYGGQPPSGASQTAMPAAGGPPNNRETPSDSGRPSLPTDAKTLAFTLGVSRETLAHVVADHLVWVLGEVGDPRAYVAAEGTKLGDMLVAAGGALRDADLSSVEVTSTIVNVQTGTSHTVRNIFSELNGDLKTVSIEPFDVVRLRPVFSDRQEGNVVVAGQVRYPGQFDITRDERLSSLLARAGGLTEEAYPYGAVFTRRSVAAKEREGNEREARVLRSQLASLASISLRPSQNNSNSQSSQSTFELLSSLADQLRDAPVVGRMSVIADPAVLAVNPQSDILLEPGDSLYVPPRPSTVTVSGEVLSGGSFRFDPRLTVEDYIRLAGGATEAADEDRIFVVLPDGSAAPVSESWLSVSSGAVPPGATVVVPRDLRPFDLNQFLGTVTQIISQLAITAASLSVVANN